MEFATDMQITVTDLAAVLGITARRIRQLVEDGVLHKEDGKFRLSAAVQEFINFKGCGQGEDDVKVERARRAAEAKLKASKAEIAALEADELKGKMHRAEDIKVLTEDMVYSVRNALLSLPGRLAVDTAAAGTAAETSDIIRKEVHKVMQELAGYKYDPSRYEELVRERKDWDAANQEDGDE